MLHNTCRLIAVRILMKYQHRMGGNFLEAIRKGVTDAVNQQLFEILSRLAVGSVRGPLLPAVIYIEDFKVTL